MQTITPFLWFDSNAEEAANFYVSVFKDGKIGRILYYGADGPGPEGSVLTIEFEINGQRFGAINGGPIFKFTEAVSFAINCETQEEIDYYWEKLIEGGGEASQCGWLKDKYGLSWQVVPPQLIDMLGSSESEKVSRMTKAMFGMQKLDIAELEAAYNGE
jgi:predicted 3-demethylubiquinone-9 3-methyltransferase (glyoxalase superfamily)